MHERERERERERESTTFNFHVIGQRSFVPTQEHILDFCFPVSRAHHISVSQLLTYYFDYLHGGSSCRLEKVVTMLCDVVDPHESSSQTLGGFKGGVKIPLPPLSIDKNF